MKRSARIWLGVFVAGAIGASALAFATLRPHCALVTGSDRIIIPLSQLGRGAIAFFCYKNEAGDRLRFVLARDDQGKVHSVLDACRQCGKFHEGYTSSGGDLVCRLCGNRYKLGAIEKGKASCVPLSLPSRQRGDQLEIRAADLKQVNWQF